MKYKLLAFLLFSLFAIQLRAQTTTNFSGTLTNSLVFKRPAPLTENYTMQLNVSDVTTGAVNYNYFIQSFTPATTGTYSVTVTSTTIGDQDTFLIVYGGAFSAASPLGNFLRANDDISESNLLSSVTGLSLTAGTTYNLVVSTYNPGQVGTVNFSVNGAGGVVVGAPPAITSATYVASTGVLTVTGTDFQAKTGAANDIVLTNLTLTGEGGSTYTLTNSTAIEISSATSFTTTLNATDKAAVNQILNKNGTSSTGATTYNLAAAAGWMANSTASADLTSNGITVSNVVAPTITSATYDASTGTFVVTGTGFLKKSGTTNDIVANKFTFTGQGASTYTLTNSADLEITNGTTFSIVLSTTDKAAVNLLLNKNGTSAVDATTYNLAAAEDWAAGADATVVVADATANAITVSNVAAANQAPTDMALTATSVNENVVANTAIGTLSTTDPDASNTFTYTFVTGTGDTDNTAFNISGSSLRISASPNFEAKSSYSVRLRTTDQGNLTFDKVFTITISNVNETPTDMALTATSVNENVAANTAVGTLSTTDPDASNTFTYTFVTGTGDTDNAAFTISGSSLSINASPNFEVKSSYSVRLRATDQGGLTFDKVFTITINNVNETPTDMALTATSVNENVAANTAVGTLSTTDPDASNTFTYTFVTGTGDTDNAAFNISGSSLRISASPNFEAKSSYSVRLRTTDQGGLTFDKVFAITISNVNETPTNMALTATSVNENVAANTAVGTLSTTDPDASNTFTYTFVTGTGDTDNAAFNISGSSLRISASPDFETKSSYSVRLRTTDQGGLTFDKVFTITINDVNETPTNTAPTDMALSAAAINENVAANTAVGTLSTTDPDAANTFTYTFVTGTGDTDNTAFNISGSSLRITSSPDFETKSSYSVRVRTTDQGGLTFDKVFNISINNVNETPTDMALTATSVNENVAANTAVGTLSTTDADASNTFTYTFVTGTGDTDNASFNISGSSLRISASPNFEAKSSYSVRLRTTDQGGLTFDKVFNISINNVNETPTDMALTATSVNENVAANTAVGTLSTTDADASNTFTYTFVTGTGDTDNASFNISGSSLRISTSPDFETKSSYSVRLRTTDQGGLTFDKVFTITINDVNETPANTAPTDIALTANSVNENVAANTAVGTLSTTDADASNTFTYTLVAGTGDTDNTAFNISGSSLRISTSPDFESKSSYSVRLRTTDQGGLTFDKVFAISISNVNETPTDIALSASTINENTGANANVASLSSTDADASNTFTYTLVAGTGDTDNTAFNISGSSLRISASPDFESKSSYSVRLRTTDQGGLTFDKVFTISINNVNEAPTDIALSASAINENAGANANVASLSSTDVDAANTFTYTLVAGTGDTDNTAFNISGSSLRITSSPDFESKSSYSVRVRTTDQGGLTFDKVFTISINNVNEAPTDLALSASAINENVTANTNVGSLATTDADASNTFTYTLVSGTGDTDNTAFNISGSSLRISASPDFETKSSYSVRLRTTDQGGLTFDKVFTISINNVNEAPTDIALSASAINENVTTNTNVGTLSSTDADASNTFTYTLVAGTGDTDNTAFNISGSSLRISASPDFESKSSYSVRLRTTDQGGLTFDKVFTISINNVNEAPTDLALSASAINENVTANTNVGTLSSTDVDAANTFTYTLVAGTGDTDNTAFNISGNSLRITSSPDFETKSSYSVRVRTTDQGGLTFDKVFTITINDIDEVVLASTSVPNPLFGTAYSATISATGGTTPYSFALTTGALPSGITLSSAGVLSGTPTNSGTFNFSVTVTAMNATSATRAYSLTIAAPTLVISPSSLPSATVNAAYSQSMNTTAGTAPYTYSITAGALPTGLSLASNGQLTGTPTVGGTYSFTVKATDASVGAGPYSNTLAYTSFVVQPAVQTITLAPTASATYGDADLDPSATSTNQTIAITYSTSDNTIATIVNGKVHILKAGTVTIYANQSSTVSYVAAVQKQQTLTIGQKALTASITGTVSKIYDANASISLNTSNFALSGKVALDDVSVAVPVSAVYDNSKVGTGKTLNVSGLLLSGTSQNNYVLTATTASANIGVITAKPITLALNASPVITKTYNANPTAALATTNYSLIGVENGDVVTVSGSATYNDKNVGTGKVITVNTFVLAGADKANYNLTTTTANTTGTITAKPITLALNATPLITKVYNSNNNAALAAGNYTLSGTENGDLVSVSGTAVYDNKNVGTSKTITVNTFVLAGADQANYSLTTTTANSSGTITAKPITLALNASPLVTKVYNASNVATLVAANYSLTGVESGDLLSVAGIAAYDTKNVGTGKTITANTFVLSGADQGNYNLGTTTANTTGAITAKPITLALNSTPVISKVYNASNLATLTAGNYSLSGIESGDLVNVAGTAAYADKKVGAAKTITVNTFALSGTDQANYSLTTTTANTSGNITAKPITLTLNAAPLITKVYNGNNAAVLATGNYTFTGLESGDVLSVNGTATYDNQNTGTGKIVTANTFVLSGTDKDNYNLTTSTATTTGAVTKAPLIITAENKTKPQNTANPVFTATYQGFVNAETSAVLTTLPVYSTTAVLASAPANYPITPSGANALNYSISYVDGVLTVKPGTPTSLTLAQNTLFENRAIGTLTGTLSSTSDDPLSTFTYALVAGTGDTDNSLFSIAGNNINTASVLNYETKSSYSVRVRTTTGNGLSLEQPLTILLSDVNEQPTFAAVANQVICANGSRQTIALTGINAGPELGQTTSFTVASNNASLFEELSISNSGLLNYKSANGQSGTATITVTVKDNGGTANGGVDSYSSTFTITVNPLPIVAITSPGSKIEISKGETLVLTASGGVSYAWTAAQGIIGATNTASLSIRPEQTTTYTVVATSAFGCTSTKQITITVVENIEIVKGTNLLTPNGDGKNDRFIIRNIDMYPNNEVKIFDRAGRLLYSKVNYKDEWNGTFQGSPLAEGVYYYIVDFGDKKTRLKGFITIVRD